ncbi:hypothetical protein [cf. Phormidesmis sp. LEGE 11477]|uniref:hypothetical protein n=1 Tax=cf. Phormidesmis sp. LEGE 11477 TaxID=1828680 RepID=UPI0018808521|nr:hypothetical protein [cf. Phormidesmis sp. LEGE 11477]MBE9062883.1 hypothetical protein [cf. Phormidesmis sp. LEGE 11477]
MSSPESLLPELNIPQGTLPDVADALRHWREHRPKMYTELYQSGTLLETANAAFEATVDEEEQIHFALIRQGYDSPTAFIMAKQAVRERYIYLPTEEDVPELMTTETGLYTYQPEPDD